MKKISLAFLLSIIIFSAGCKEKSLTKPVETNNAPRPTFTQILNKTATPTFKPTNEPTSIPSVTWTPLPTLPAQEARIKIRELLETNGGCELPCWWGFTPNKTVWHEARQILSSFVVNLVQSEPIIQIENGKNHAYTEVQFYYEITNNSTGRISIGIKDDTIMEMVVYPPAVEYNKYQLHQILTLLGPPNRVFINAQSSSPIPELPPAVLTLDYSDIGVWASYGYIPSKNGENLKICPKSSIGKVSIYDNLGGRLRLFDPSSVINTLTIQEYANRLGGFTALNIEDATNMNTETFYETFIQSSPSSCLETPADLWP